MGTGHVTRQLLSRVCFDDECAHRTAIILCQIVLLAETYGRALSTTEIAGYNTTAQGKQSRGFRVYGHDGCGLMAVSQAGRRSLCLSFRVKSLCITHWLL